MIGFLRGAVAAINETQLLLDVNGVGYRVNVPTSVPASVHVGDAGVMLFTSLVVTDDALTLYGFLSDRERDIFETLTTVSGIGPKVAVKLLCIPRDRLVEAIQSGDAAVLTTVPGVGKKIAQRVCLELRDKIAAGFGVKGASPMPVFMDVKGEAADAVSALQSLGFSPSEIRAFLKTIPETELEKLSAQEIITRCLKKRK